MPRVALHQPVVLPENSPVFNFEHGTIEAAMGNHVWGIGRYGENRQDAYSEFPTHVGRTVHLGVDLFAPAGTPVFAVADGYIHKIGTNAAPGDYGPTIVVEHFLESDERIFALYGHLGSVSLLGKNHGTPVSAGKQIGIVGNSRENGGWPPHLHFQLSWIVPSTYDMPGVVTPDDFEVVTESIYPDPRMILGDIY